MIVFLLFMILLVLVIIAGNTAPPMVWLPPYEPPPKPPMDPKSRLAGIAIIAATAPVTFAVMWMLVSVQDLTGWRWLSW